MLRMPIFHHELNTKQCRPCLSHLLARLAPKTRHNTLAATRRGSFDARRSDGNLAPWYSYKKPPARSHVYHRFYFIGFRWRIDPLDIGGTMGTVPRHESVPNVSMRQDRELLKWHS
jgi:hypothetical protein